MISNNTRCITPMSGVREIGSNVPCLKHFFRCLETSGDTWTDSKGGVVIRPADQLPVPKTLTFDTALKTVEPDMTVATPLHSGVWATCPSGYSILNFAVVQTTHSGDSTGFRMPVGVGGSTFGITSAIYGTSHGSHLIVGDGVNSTTIYDNTVGVSFTPPTGVTIANSTDCYIKEIFTSGGLLKMEAVDHTGSSLTTLSLNAAASTGTIIPEAVSRPIGAKFYGWAVFYFLGAIPTDVDIACKWMAGEWRRGNRYIWPGWINRT